MLLVMRGGMNQQHAHTLQVMYDVSGGEGEISFSRFRLAAQ